MDLEKLVDFVLYFSIEFVLLVVAFIDLDSNPVAVAVFEDLLQVGVVGGRWQLGGAGVCLELVAL